MGEHPAVTITAPGTCLDFFCHLSIDHFCLNKIAWLRKKSGEAKGISTPSLCYNHREVQPMTPFWEISTIHPSHNKDFIYWCFVKKEMMDVKCEKSLTKLKVFRLVLLYPSNLMGRNTKYRHRNIVGWINSGLRPVGRCRHRHLYKKIQGTIEINLV